jgi:hypothetical protein
LVIREASAPFGGCLKTQNPMAVHIFSNWFAGATSHVASKHYYYKVPSVLFKVRNAYLIVVNIVSLKLSVIMIIV